MTFEFPLLGSTGEGEVVYPPGTAAADWQPGDRPIYWQPEGDYTGYFVTYQLDRPACAFRCHSPIGSSPCNKETADRFIEWAQALEASS